MRRVSILVIVCLLALSGMMAAMAYSNATVTNTGTLTIANTNTALVALSPNPAWSWENKVGIKDGTAYVENGELKFDFGKGALGKPWGLQPNSVYEWIPLFELRNMSKEKIKVTVKAEGDFAQYITLGSCGQGQATGTPATADWLNQGEALTFVIDPIKNQGDMWHIRNIAVKVCIPSGVDLGPISGSIIVEANAIN